ncbi:response regulator transcription factor [Paenibacillus mesophilus]|uniref:response regulator n=1 Tax=Paenibacillus mesophilus TaxID=2582849 RepID=UPI00110F1442|nr:response regulator transcription factor [Paenibacillus mesophilus]TMV46255.1 response regulator transcription factor [Paenibacillus mesophilus]
MVKIKLMIVEDDPVWMKYLTEYIEKENDIAVVKQAFTMEDATDGITNSTVDVVLIDLQLSEDADNLCGLQVASKLSDLGIDKLIMLTSCEDTEIILESFDLGAVNYMTKTSYRDIPQAVREAYAGKVSLHSDVSSVLTAELRKERKLKILTPTEREVYDLKKQGLSKTQIAKKLHKSVETVKKQVKLIQSKLTNGSE